MHPGSGDRGPFQLDSSRGELSHKCIWKSTSAPLAPRSSPAPASEAAPEAGTPARGCPQQVRGARLLQQAQLLLPRDDLMQARAPLLALWIQFAPLAPRAGL